MLPQDFITDLLSRVDIVDVVGRHVELKRGGVNFMGLCPFHGEKSPSFSVSPAKQFYYCFGCGAAGNALKFLTEFNGLPFLEAVRELAQQVGMTMPESKTTPEQEARADAERARRATLSDVLAKAGEHYRAALKANPQAIAYLKKRGLTGEVAAQFGIGYAADGWRALASVFPRYDDPLLVDSGLVIASGDDGPEQKRYDRFRDRIMFPIRSVKGEVIGFGGRVLDKGEPKYLNSPETPVFHKGQELYGLFEARQGLRAKGYCLVVEGYMDVVALAQWGYPNTVATLGTACTAEHIAKLFRFTESVVFSFDGDAAGRRAAGRALEAALPHATDLRTVRFLFLPTEHDPDSYIRDLGAEAFEQAVGRAVPLSAQLITQAGADCDLATAEGRSRMLSQAGPLVEMLPDGLLRAQVVQELAQLGGIAADVLQAHWAKRNAGRTRPAQSANSANTSTSADGQPLATDDPQRQPQAHDPFDRGPVFEDSSSRPRWSRDGKGRGADRFRPRPMAGRRLPPQAASLLDRTAWLLARHAGVWLDLSAEAHDFLSAQPAPYSQFFAALERTLHEHGTITMAALLSELRITAASAADSDDPDQDGLRPLLDRLAGFHEVEDDDAPLALVEAVLRRLRQRAVKDELDWLMESGELSDDATARRNALFALTATLKNPQSAAG